LIYYSFFTAGKNCAADNVELGWLLFLRDDYLVVVGLLAGQYKYHILYDLTDILLDKALLNRIL